MSTAPAVTHAEPSPTGSNHTRPSQAGPSVETLAGLTPGSDVDFEPGTTIGDLQLRHVRWTEGDEGLRGTVTGTFARPFLSGLVEIGLGDDGSPTGVVSTSSVVGLGAVELVDLDQRIDDWNVELPPPVPQVDFDGQRITVRPVGAEWTAQATSIAEQSVVSSEEGLVVDVLSTELPGLSGLFVSPEGETLPPEIARLVERLTAVASERLRIATSLLVDRAVVSGERILLPEGTELGSETGLAFLAEAVGAIAAGMSGAVPDRVPDPTESEAPAGAAAPATGEPEPGEAREVEVVAPGAEQPTSVPPSEAEPPSEGEDGGVRIEPGAEPPPVELHIPPAPAEPTPEHADAIRTTARAASSAGRRTTDLPTASDSTEAAQAAVTIPDAEVAGRAEDALAERLGTAPTPAPEIAELCRGIRAAVREHRPVDEDELLGADLEEPAREVGQSLNESVESEGDRVRSGYDAINEPPPTTAPRPATPAETPQAGIGSPDLAVEDAAPPPIPEEDLSLDADRDEIDRRVAESEIHRPTTEVIPDEPFSTVREGQAEMSSLAEQGPAQVAAEQQLAIDQSREQMQLLQAQALESLEASRATTVRRTGEHQARMVESEEETRERISREASEIFSTAQTQVNQLLAPLSTNAMNMWNARIRVLTTEFRNSLDQVQRWIDERHSGLGGGLVAAWDALTGLPGWVTRSYDRAEETFTEGVCDALTEISSDVEQVIASAEEIIDNARQRIRELFTDLPAGLQDWASEQLAGFESRLDGLSEQVQSTRTDFIDQVSREAVSAVRSVQEEVEALREAARGLIGDIIAAVGEFLDDPITAIINGLLRLVGIPPASFWALVEKISQVIEDIANDPMNFVNNLVDAVRTGFEQFFDRFGEHVISGFWDWLFSGLASVGVELPSDTSLKSLITFVLQLMGITWPNVREILVRYIGEENVELIERAWELLSTLIEQGPEGLFEMIKERLDPATILQTILDAAIEYLIQTLIEQVVMRVIGLLNPAGAIYQAIELIYKVLKWIFENAARIFRFVETVVNGIADIIAGNISAMANAVESALAQLIPVVIDFLAGLLGLGDLPDEIADVIRRLQEMVLEGLDLVIGFLVQRARALLESLGFGGEEEPEEEPEEADGDDELGTTVRFSAAGEAHRLWISLAGGDATLMVASAPASLDERLDQWERQAVDRFDGGTDELEEATGLVGSLRTLLAEADAEADAVAAAYERAQALDEDEALPSDDQIERKQRAVARLLDRLLTLLGVDDTESKLAEIATRLPIFGERRVEQAHQAWAERLELVQVGQPEDRHALWPDGRATLRGSQTAAMALLRSGGLPAALIGYFQQTDRDRSVDTQAFYEHVLVNISPEPNHDTRLRFLQSLGNGAQAAIRASLPTRLSQSRLSDAEKNEAQSSFADVSYVLEGASALGRFDGLNDRPPDHRWFEPLDLPDDPGDNFSYRTKTGQTFTIEVGEDELTRKVDGSRLRRFPGRGVTQDSPFFTRNAGLNRAHIIANQFGGSGFKRGANLVSTSAYYNQNRMADREGQIRGWLEDLPEPPKTIEDVEFDMSVELAYGEMTDEGVLGEIREDPELPDESIDVLAALIKTKITELGISEALRRVLDMDYDVTQTWIDGEEQGETLHVDLDEADRWLLLERRS